MEVKHRPIVFEWGWGDGRVDYVLSATIKCLITQLLDVICVVKSVISAMSCVDKIEHAHQVFSDIMNMNI